MGAQEEDDQASPLLLRPKTMGDVLSELSTRVNSRPVAWWGPEKEKAFQYLGKVFAGKTEITADQRLRYVCIHHAAIAARPKLFARAKGVGGITAVHGCALNGFIKTIQVMITETDIDWRLKTDDGYSASDIARARGHKDIVDYLESLDADTADSDSSTTVESGSHSAPEEDALPTQIFKTKRSEASSLLRKSFQAQELANQLRDILVQEEEKKRRSFSKAKNVRQPSSKEGEVDEMMQYCFFRSHSSWRSTFVDIDERQSPGIAFYPCRLP